MNSEDSAALTPLYSLHKELGAKLVPFAGYQMPVQYPLGILKEHLHTREKAGLFDVSHMGQVVIRGRGATAQLEKLLPVDLETLAVNHHTYTLLLNDQGGIRDDLIIARWGEECFFLVINAACKVADTAYLREQLPDLEIEELTQRGLIALQGPEAREVMSALVPEARNLVFMTGMETVIEGIPCYLSCSGYTGEDGFEISLPAEATEQLARKLLADPRVEPIGLGARDSLRLEAGLCLYGHELNETTTPIEAGLGWSISPCRRSGGSKAGGFPGADIILEQMEKGIQNRRVGLQVLDKAPVREGTEILDEQGEPAGQVVSGGFAPSVGSPIAMAYVKSDLCQPGTELVAMVRGKPRQVSVVKLPFVKQRYYRG